MNSDFTKILEVLVRHKVNFVITGGVSAVLQGAPVTTFDLDIVHSCAAENIARLRPALEEMQAYYRTRPDQKLTPDPETLAGKGHHLLITTFGPLDLLGSVGRGLRYEHLIGQSEILPIDAFFVRVQSLDSLIRLKEDLGMEKDRMVLPVLKRTLEEKQKHE